MGRFCKTCRFLSKRDDMYWCDWSVEITVPWPEKTRKITRGGILGRGIGRWFVESDWTPPPGYAGLYEPEDVQGSWSENMDCPTWEAAQKGGA